jgi:hypothetical protein
MTRFASSSLQAQSEQTQIAFRLLVDIDVTSGTVYACSGRQFIYARSNTYSPIGTLGGVERIQEDSEPFPRAVRMWLSAVQPAAGTNSAVIASAMNEQLFNKQVRLYRGFMDLTTMTMPNTPELAFKGQIAAYSYRPSDPERGPHFEIEVESRMLRRMNPAYFTQETYWTTLSRSGDTFFKYVPMVAGATAKWGLENAVMYGSSQPTIEDKRPYYWR